jgi:hypothetical protein
MRARDAALERVPCSEGGDEQDEEPVRIVQIGEPGSDEPEWKVRRYRSARRSMMRRPSVLFRRRPFERRGSGSCGSSSTSRVWYVSIRSESADGQISELI